MQFLIKKYDVHKEFLKIRGSLSINIILLFFFLVGIILLFMPLYNDLSDFKKEYDSLYEHDYDLASIEKAFLVNGYYSVEEAYIKSKDSKEFYKLLLRKNSSFYKSLLGQKYVKSPHTKYELLVGGGDYLEIVKKEKCVEFYINYYYEYRSIERWKRKKYRVYCPFEKLDIKKNSSYQLKEEDIKKMFIEIA